MNTELHQVFKLPTFFAHYQEHKERNAEISLLSFIVIHYFNGDVKDGDYARDQELPFKSSNHCDEILISIALPPEDSFEPDANEFPASKTVVSTSPQFISSSFLFSIWQPPKS